MKTTKTPTMAALATVVAISSSLVGGHPAYASTGSPTPDSVLVTGQGDVSGNPDTLNADFGVEATATTVGAALDRANAAAGKMRDALVHGGVATTDLQTSSVGISSTRKKDDGPITGYTATEGLTAKIHDLGKGGALLSATVAAGGDAARINGVSFTLENDTALLAQARKKAFADARGRAELYAHEAGRPLGRVLKVSEGGSDTWTPGGPIRYAAAASAVPLEPGQQHVTASVTVEWALG